MALLWPGVLVLVLLVPLLLSLSIWTGRRRKRAAARFSSLLLVRGAVQGSSRVRRYLPVGLFCIALASLTVGAARPVDVVAISTSSTTVILAIDVSGSMCSSDVPPSRLEAAEVAAA